MTQVTPPDLFTDSVMRRINFRVNRLGRKFGLPREDCEDLRQAFCLAVVRANENFDPQKCSADQFVRMVLNRHYKYFVRKLAQRADDRLDSIDALELDASNPDYDQLLVDPKSGDDRRQMEISEDVQTVISRLPEDLRRLCYELMAHTPPEIASRQNIHHSAVYRAIDELREYFLQAGIDKFF